MDERREIFFRTASISKCQGLMVNLDRVSLRRHRRRHEKGHPFVVPIRASRTLKYLGETKLLLEVTCLQLNTPPRRVFDEVLGHDVILQGSFTHREGFNI